LSSANVLYMVVCEKCKRPFKLDDCQQINLGTTPDEIDNRENVVYLCEKCEKNWVNNFFHKMQFRHMNPNNDWMDAWNCFMTGRRVFIFR
jgi:uncharacterized protein with PIN domain